MQRVDWKQVLLGTLEDRQLSRAERRAFKQLLTPLGGDRDQLGRIRAMAFEIARESIVDPTGREVLPWLEDVLRTLDSQQIPATTVSEAWFSPDPGCVARIMELFRLARKSAEVCVFTITDDRIAESMIEAHRRGIEVRVITDNEKRHDPGSDVRCLEESGLPVRTDRSCDHMHHKYAVFDERTLLTGSYNWTRAASLVNDDNFLVTDDAHLSVAFRAHFNRLWDALA